MKTSKIFFLPVVCQYTIYTHKGFLITTFGGAVSWHNVQYQYMKVEPKCRHNKTGRDWLEQRQNLEILDAFMLFSLGL